MFVNSHYLEARYETFTIPTFMDISFAFALAMHIFLLNRDNGKHRSFRGKLFFF